MCGARYLVARAGAGARAGAQLCRRDYPLPQCPGGAIHVGEHGDDLDHSDGAIRNQQMGVGSEVWGPVGPQLLARLWALRAFFSPFGPA